MKKKLLIEISCLLICFNINAQTNVFPSTGAAGIGTTTPDHSSLLDIVSISKGVLIPRMTVTQRNAIIKPSTGLLIFQTNSTPGFYYYNGIKWQLLSSNSANKTLSNLSSPISINADLLPNAINAHNIGSLTKSWRNLYLDSTIYIDSVRFIAFRTGSGDGNTAIGKH